MSHSNAIEQFHTEFESRLKNIRQLLLDKKYPHADLQLFKLNGYLDGVRDAAHTLNQPEVKTWAIAALVELSHQELEFRLAAAS